MVTKDIEYFSNVNLKGNEMIEARVENVSALPTASEGRIVYLTADAEPNKAGFYYGTVDSWIRVTIKSETDAIITDVKGLQDAIGSTEGSGTIIARIVALETSVNGNGPNAPGLIAKVGTLESTLTTLKDTTVPGIQTTADSALSKAEANAAAIGADDSAGTVKGRIKTLETTMVAEQTNIDKLQETVGDASKGLVKDVATLETKVGTEAAEGVEATGLYKKVADNTALINTKVTAVDGFGLSKNDFTDAYKTKLDGVATGAQVNVLEAVKVKTTESGEYSALAITDKAVSLDLSGYALKSQITSAVNWKGTVATTSALPTSDRKVGDMWHVDEKSAEYIWNGTAWEEVGSIVNLTGYYTKTETDGKISSAVSTAKTELNAAIALKANDADLKTVAKTGSYNDLTDKPVVDTVLNGTSTNAIANKPVYDALAGKVDKLGSKPSAGTFTKVTINAEGQVTAGADLEADDIPALTHEKITDFATASIVAGKVKFTNVNMTVSTEWQDVGATAITEYPSAITAFDSDGKVIGVALRYNSTSQRVQYCVNTAVSGVTVVVSL